MVIVEERSASGSGYGLEQIFSIRPSPYASSRSPPQAPKMSVPRNNRISEEGSSQNSVGYATHSDHLRPFQAGRNNTRSISALERFRCDLPVAHAALDG